MAHGGASRTHAATRAFVHDGEFELQSIVAASGQLPAATGAFNAMARSNVIKTAAKAARQSAKFQRMEDEDAQPQLQPALQA